MEIERKWLVKEVPDLSNVRSETICQAYICTGPVIRVRQQGSRFILTVKGGGLMAREEMNLPLDEPTFYRLLTKSEGRIIKKTRYFLPQEDGLMVELDHFESPMDGLYLAEIEFPTVEEAKAFPGLPWFGEDVTEDIRYHNSVMSKMNESTGGSQ